MTVIRQPSRIYQQVDQGIDLRFSAHIHTAGWFCQKHDLAVFSQGCQHHFLLITPAQVADPSELSWSILH